MIPIVFETARSPIRNARSLALLVQVPRVYVWKGYRSKPEGRELRKTLLKSREYHLMAAVLPEVEQLRQRVQTASTLQEVMVHQLRRARSRLDVYAETNR